MRALQKQFATTRMTHGADCLAFWYCKLLLQSTHFHTLSQMSCLLHLALKYCDGMHHSNMQESGLHVYTGIEHLTLWSLMMTKYYVLPRGILAMTFACMSISALVWLSGFASMGRCWHFPRFCFASCSVKQELSH